ncbi:MAG: hypothetical protein COA47_11600 [Robiginitomaculum sp.]|nr:MAG: hypothetical protein COA47_11600 [Robiginitomaculum sp.]
MIYRLIGIIILGLVLSLSTGAWAQGKAASDTQSAGVLDLTDHDFSVQSQIDLDKHWQFFWREFVDPGQETATSGPIVSMPHGWRGQNFDGVPNDGTGFASYRLRILLPDNAPSLTLQVKGLAYASSVYANGVLIRAMGQPGTSAITEIARSYNTQSVLPVLPKTGAELEIIIHISNHFHTHGGIVETLTLGESGAMAMAASRKNLAMTMMIGCLLMLALYHFLLFAARPSDRAPLHFAFYLAVVLTYVVVSNGVLDTIGVFFSTSLLLKIEYLCLILGGLTVLEFVWSVYPQLHWRKVNQAVRLYTVLAGGLIIFTSARTYTSLLPIYNLGLLSAVVLNLAIVILAIRLKLPDAKVLLLGVFVIAGGVILGIVGHTAGGNAPAMMIYFALSFFVLTQAVVIGRQAARATETSERLRGKLQVANSGLEEKVRERTSELRASVQAAEAANQAKTDFLSMMSHELRTPMNAVLGSAQSLKTTRLSKKAHELVDTLSDAGQILMTLLNDILDLAKIEAGKLEIDQTNVDLRHILGGVERLYRAQANDKGLDFSLEIDDNVPQAIKSDPTRLRQIVFNLVSNAIKFTGAGSVTIHVSAEPVGQSKNQIRISITDTGIGIAEEARGRLFSRFEQAETSTSRRFSGTGLGLAISKQLAELMGGVLNLQSEVGKGSTFTLCLEAETMATKPVSKTTPNASPALSAKSKKLRILAAEDNLMNRRVLTAFLASIGQQAIYADHGQDALDRLAEQPFDLVLMDIQMPVMDGVSAVKALRANAKGLNANIPVIAMTANAMAGDRQSYLDAGMNDYVAKPMDVRALYAAIGRVMSASAKPKKAKVVKAKVA